MHLKNVLWFSYVRLFVYLLVLFKTDLNKISDGSLGLRYLYLKFFLKISPPCLITSTIDSITSLLTDYIPFFPFLLFLPNKSFFAGLSAKKRMMYASLLMRFAFYLKFLSG